MHIDIFSLIFLLIQINVVVGNVVNAVRHSQRDQCDPVQHGPLTATALFQIFENVSFKKQKETKSAFVHLKREVF